MPPCLTLSIIRVKWSCLAWSISYLKGVLGLPSTTIADFIEPLPKKSSEKNLIFIIAKNFNETSLALIHITSDYFLWLLLSKFP